MENNLKNHKNHRLEYSKTFIEKYAQDSKDLEILINNDYNQIFNKFINLIEKECANFCKITRTHKTQVENNVETTKPEVKTVKSFKDHKQKVIEPTESNVKTNKILNNEKIPHKNDLDENKKNIHQPKPENDDPSGDKLVGLKKDNVSNVIKVKKNLGNLESKIAKNKQLDEELMMKMHPPLATSSILMPPSKENDHKELNETKVLTSPKGNHMKKPMTQEHNALLNQSGKVKQIVEMVEARMKDMSNNAAKNTPLLVSKTVKNTNQFVKNQVKEKLIPRLSNKFKKKTSSTIDKQKLRNSITNQDHKRKSIKKLNAIIKDIAENTAQTNVVKKMNPTIEVKHVPTKIPSHVPVSQINSKMLKTNINNHVQASDNKNLHPSIQSLYHVKPTEKNGFGKFLERNTPCKISKIDLAAKEKRELERLNEREKLMNEKAEISKKKREEKMKKIAEVKLKNETELKKRQDELSGYKSNDSHEVKKKIEEPDKSKEIKEVVHHPKAVNHHLPESLNGIVKNSPFMQKSETKNHVLHSKENKIYSSPKVMTTIKKETEHSKTPTVNSTKPKAQMNILKQIENACEAKPIIKKEPEFENYGIHDLDSNDETDDEEEPSKPIPNWAKDPLFTKTAKNQSFKFINFTKLFRASGQNEINLDQIFKVKRKKFYERSSSANWNTSSIWNSSGIHGNESFRQLHK